ncbi:MAG: membrane dipeptidase [Bryobacterales bacterium]|nr:membrane dipeptidase [Bryobacterales bacterium]
MLLIDSHLDLSWNALGWNRDLTRTVPEIRRTEVGMTEKGRATNTVSLPDMRRGNVGICLGTVLARGNPEGGYPGLDFRTREMASAMTLGQLAYYQLLERQGHIRLIGDRPSLDACVAAWDADRATAPIGLVVSMEGADPILSPADIPLWWERGLRAVGPVHYGVSAYAHGTGSPGGLLPDGPALLRAMEAVGMILDVTHFADQAFDEALGLFGGFVMASHHNCRALVDHQRQLTDPQIRTLVARGAVIGVALDAWMLYPGGWVRGETSNTVVSFEDVADHIDHICQLAGNASHVAIGSDLDGGYGTEQCPHDLDTIADLQKLAPLLSGRGYSDSDIAGVFHGNWLRFFREAWGPRTR